ncbi:hypothetical protein HaLaN_20140 [Haematococcus lacustris]|uniref:Uncharacterized protein n=1 Tax=Haematococcus lacustris TaxID=44745 RepID=A0A699ZVF1_HAELA|nr:hypothetical protein HaLaN_20140 [Haematococcus lacustris]
MFAKDMRGDAAFDLTRRLQDARKLVVEIERDIKMVSVDLAVAVSLRDLYEEMSVGYSICVMLGVTFICKALRITRETLT